MTPSPASIPILVALITCHSLASEMRQNYAVCNRCTTLPSLITRLFDIFLSRTTARSVLDCAAKCQRTSACVSAVYCCLHQVAQCTLIIKLLPKVDLELPLLGLSLQITQTNADTAGDESPVLFNTLDGRREFCKCVVFPAMLGLSLDRLNLLVLEIGLNL